MEEDLAVTFREATDCVQAVASSLGQDELLYLYARFKQVTVGPCNTSRPGFLEFQAKKKWEAWKALGTLSKVQAMSEYIAKLNHCEPGWRIEHRKSPGLGVTVSKMAKDYSDDETLSENIFDLCKKGRLKELKQKYKERPGNATDENKRTLLHWACDRGHTDIVEFLIRESSDVDAQDEDQLTPLHYAAQCGYTGIVKTLLVSGANPTLPDTDGDTPLDCSETDEIKQMLTAAVDSWVPS